MEVLAIVLCVLVASQSVSSDPREQETIRTDESSNIGMAFRENVADASFGDCRKRSAADLMRDARKNPIDRGLAGRKSATLLELKSLEKSPLVVKPPFVTPSGFRTTKKNMKYRFIGAIVNDRRRMSSPSVSSNRVNSKETWVKYLKSLRKALVVIRPSRLERNLANRTGTLLRKKRSYQVDDPYYSSLDEYNSIFNKFPVDLKYAIAATNHFEHALLLGYATSKGSRSYIDSLLSDYIQAKRSERKMVKKLVEAAGTGSPELISNYKALRKGVAWLYVKLSPNLKQFFETPSAFLTEYDILKRDELDSIDSYLDGTLRYDEDLGDQEVKFEKSLAAAERQKAAEGEEQLANVKDADTTRSLSESYEAMRDVRRRLPDDLRSLVEVTDNVDEALVNSYSRMQYAPTKILADYYASKQMERELLKELAAEMSPTAASDLISNYKMLRKGRAWNYVKLQDRFKIFFRRPTAALLEYETLKKDELASIDRFLNDENQIPGAEKTSVLKTISQAVAHGAKLAEEGRTTYATLLRSFPDELGNKILQTDGIEREMLTFYAKSQSVPKQVLDAYSTARNEERAALQKLISEQPQDKTTLVDSYKTLRKGEAWKFMQVEQPYAEFFQRPSAALTEYETLKKEELMTLDSFLKPTNYKGARKRHVQEGETWQTVARAVNMTNDVLLSSTESLGRTIDETELNTTAEQRMFAQATGGNASAVSNTYDLDTTADIVHETTSAEERNNSTAAAAGALLSQKIFGIVLVISLLLQLLILISILVFYRDKIAEKLCKKKTVTSPPGAPEKVWKYHAIQAYLEPAERLSAIASTTETEQVASHLLRTTVKDADANVTSEVPKKSKHTGGGSTANAAPINAQTKTSKTTHVDQTNISPVSEASATLKTTLKDATPTSELAEVSTRSLLTTFLGAPATPGVTKVSSKPLANILLEIAAPVDVTKVVPNSSMFRGKRALSTDDATDVSKK